MSESSWTMSDSIGMDLQGAQDAIQSLTDGDAWFSSSTDLTGKGRGLGSGSLSEVVKFFDGLPNRWTPRTPNTVECIPNPAEWLRRVMCGPRLSGAPRPLAPSWSPARNLAGSHPKQPTSPVPTASLVTNQARAQGESGAAVSGWWCR